MLRPQFPGVNHKRVYRLYRQANLAVRRRKKGKRLINERVPLQLARTVNEVLRGQERLGRWGGDEWLLVMPGTAIDEMPGVFDRLRDQLAGQHLPGLPMPHGVTFSMGAVSLGEPFDSIETLVEEAERQLLRAKAEGRDRLRCARSRRGDAGPRDPASHVAGADAARQAVSA